MGRKQDLSSMSLAVMLAFSVFGAAAADPLRVIPLPAEAVKPSAPPIQPDTQAYPTLRKLSAWLNRSIKSPPSAGKVASARGPAARSVSPSLGSPFHFPASGVAVSAPAQTMAARPAASLPAPELHLRGIGTPRSMRGRRRLPGGRSPLQLAERVMALSRQGSDDRTSAAFLRRYREYLRIDDPDAELTLKRRDEDELGRRHLRYRQQYRGLPVWPAELIVHVDAAGDVESASGAYVPTPNQLDPTPAVTAEEAVAVARRSMDMAETAEASAAALIVYAPGDRESRLAWKLELPVSLRQHWVVVVDAQDGKLLTSFNDVQEVSVPGSGTDLSGEPQPLNLWRDGASGPYYLLDASRPMFVGTSSPPKAAGTIGGILISDARNQPNTSDPQTIPPTYLITKASATNTPTSTWLPDGVSAAVNLARVYVYYLDRHGRNAIDGQGGNILGVVRLGNNYDNAFWASDLGTMFFGNGDRYAGALDVVAHEMTHGVTSYTANLIYQNQPGALNEAMSDIFGEMVEAYTRGSNDWVIGRELSQPIRDMANPSRLRTAFGPYPSTMSQYIKTTEDNGGVHLNSSIVNHAYYLLAETAVGGIGLIDAEKIFYRALTVYLTANAQFADARLACVQAAEDLFGIDSVQVQKTKDAFDGVGILEPGSGTVSTPPVPVVSSDAEGTVFVYTDAKLGNLVGRKEFPADAPIGVPLSQFNVTPSRPSVSADGSLAAYVSQDADVCLLVTSIPFGDRCAGVAGAVHSVAMSPDKERYAFVLNDPTANPPRPVNEIFIVDVKHGRNRRLPLIAPGTEGVKIDSVKYADKLAFTASGRYLIYDALNSIDQDGTRVQAWSIYAYDLATRQTLILVPPVPGRNIGSPSVGNASDDFMTFESVDAAGTSTIFATRLSTGEQQPVAVSRPPAGIGTSAPVYNGDDKAIVYTDADGAAASGASLIRQPLLDDRITPTGAKELWLPDAYFGVVYRRGSRFKLSVSLKGNGQGEVLGNPGGIDCGFTCAALYPRNNNRVTLRAVPASQMSFDGWRGGCAGTGDCQLTLATDVAVGAVFRPFKRLRVVKRGNGSITSVVASASPFATSTEPLNIDCGTRCETAFARNSVVTLTAAPEADSEFVGWSGACRGKGTCSVTMSKARTVRAAFRLRRVSLTVSRSGQGRVDSASAAIRCGRKCTVRYPIHSIVVLTAKADAGSSFGGWNGGCAGAAETCTLSLEGDTSIGAAFVQP